MEAKLGLRRKRTLAKFGELKENVRAPRCTRVDRTERQVWGTRNVRDTYPINVITYACKKRFNTLEICGNYRSQNAPFILNRYNAERFEDVQRRVVKSKQDSSQSLVSIWMGESQKFFLQNIEWSKIIKTWANLKLWVPVFILKT
jgi:hypothetical protein